MSQETPDIVLTVGLPMYRCEKIAWLALEGLCRQQDVDFPWELIVAEEPEEAFTEQCLRGYEARLRAVGCQRIVYLENLEWVPLSTKWCRIAKGASPHSDVLVLHPGDDYSHRRRLANTFALFKDQRVDWVQSALGLFLNIASGKVSLYDYSLKEDYPDPKTGWADFCRSRGWLDTTDPSLSRSQWRKYPSSICTATRTRHLRQLDDQQVRRSVDGWLFCSIEKVKQAPLVVAWDQSDEWSTGICTHGLNRLTTLRGWLVDEARPPFRVTELVLDRVVPPDVAKRLAAVRLDAAMNVMALQEEGVRELKESFRSKKANLLDRVARRDAEIEKMRMELEAIPRPWWWYRRLVKERLPALRALFRRE